MDMRMAFPFVSIRKPYGRKIAHVLSGEKRIEARDEVANKRERQCAA